MFDDFGRALVRRSIRILGEFFTRPALPQEIPQAVELNVDFVEPAPVLGADATAFVEKRMLLGNERLNGLMELLIVHRASLPQNGGPMRDAPQAAKA